MNAVIGRYDENCNISCLRSTCTHLCKCGVTGSIDESKALAIFDDLIRTDTLCNSASFGIDYFFTANRVE